MLVISLTTIPPRFGQLPRVLAALSAQGADRVALVVPRAWRRFEAAPLPPLPESVAVLTTATDLGPAGKLLAPAAAFPGADILYGDDDWLYGPGWARAFVDARGQHGPDAVIAASTWPTERIGRRGGTVAQGFAGVLVPAGTAARVPPPPPAAWAVDDIWLSGWFAGLGLGVAELRAARALCTPLASPGALQDAAGRDRANRDAAACIRRIFGIWPEG